MPSQTDGGEALWACSTLAAASSPHSEKPAMASPREPRDGAWSITGGQPVGDVVARIVAAGDGNDDVLLATKGVRHRRTALRRRHPDGTDFLACPLVIGMHHRAARASGLGRELWIAGDHEV